MFGRAKPRVGRTAMTGRMFKQTATPDRSESPAKPKRVPLTERTRSARRRRQLEEQEEKAKSKLNVGSLLRNLVRGGKGESRSSTYEGSSSSLSTSEQTGQRENEPVSTAHGRSQRPNDLGRRIFEQRSDLHQRSPRRERDTPGEGKPDAGAAAAARKASQQVPRKGYDSVNASPARSKGAGRPSAMTRLTTGLFTRNPESRKQKVNQDEVLPAVIEPPAKVSPTKADSINQSSHRIHKQSTPDRKKGLAGSAFKEAI